MKPIGSQPADGTVPAHVAILMATYDGEAHLPAQLASLAAQDHPNWSLVVSDDGSRDATRRILDDFAAAGHRVTVLPGPGR
ncbi:glycosyltransferase, partial [Hoeflea sp.]|uniref:glycosyltransferase n=1 Tax=Hoeflea sp. TaxID=1940281 RepID=UPI0019A853A6